MPFQEIKGDDFCIQLMVWVFSLFEILPWMLAIIHQPFIDCQTQKSPTSVDLSGKSNKMWNFSLSFLRRHGVSCKLPFFGVWVNPHDGIHDSPLTFSSARITGWPGHRAPRLRHWEQNATKTVTIFFRHLLEEIIFLTILRLWLFWDGGNGAFLDGEVTSHYVIKRLRLVSPGSWHLPGIRHAASLKM